MNRTLLQIKMLYDSMGKSEKKIADWILEHPREILPLSITELAEQSKSSEATIVRFAKRVGFSGYQELKISLAQENGKKIANETITEKDSCFDIFDKITNDIYISLEKTKKAISTTALECCANAITDAEKIVIFGLGNSASVALDASHKFLRAGCNSFAYSDNHMQAIAASHLTRNDVVLGISHSGSSKDIVEALKIAKQNGATTICITNKGKSPITKVSDIILFTDADETRYNILALNSRIAQLTIIDAIYYHLICHKNPIAAIENTERALLSKKY